MYPPIVPYLAVPDGAAALDFLRRAFDAEEKLRVPGPDGRAVMHAELVVGSGLVMLAEPPPGGGFEAPDPNGPSPVGHHGPARDRVRVERLFAQAVSAGGRPEIAPRDEPWGARFAGIADPSGHRWWLHAPLAEADRAP